MENLVLVEDGMVRIYDYEKEKIVDGRELHKQLGVGKRYTTWIQDKIKKYSFEKETDFFPVLGESSGGRRSTEYYLKMDTAKEIAMVENNDKGREIRKYFIEVEKKFREQVNTFVVPTTFADALRLAADQQEQIEEMKPKVESFEMFIDGTNYQKMNAVAKSLGIGRNKLFEYLRDKEILMKDNVPYQRYIDSGYFVVKETHIKQIGENKPQTYVTSKGVDYISKLLRKENLKLMK